MEGRSKWVVTRPSLPRSIVGRPEVEHRGVAHLEQARQPPRGRPGRRASTFQGEPSGFGAEGRHVAAEVEQRRGYVALSRSRARSSSAAKPFATPPTSICAPSSNADGASRSVHLHGGVATRGSQRGHLVGGGHLMVAGRSPRRSSVGTPWGRRPAVRCPPIKRRGRRKRGRRWRDGCRRAACGVGSGLSSLVAFWGQQLVQFGGRAAGRPFAASSATDLADDVHGEGQRRCP